MNNTNQLSNELNTSKGYYKKNSPQMQLYQTSNKPHNQKCKTRSKLQYFKPTNHPNTHCQTQLSNYRGDTLSECEPTNRLNHNDSTFSRVTQVNLIDMQSRYKTIQSFLYQENANLKQQNQMLINQIKKISSKERKIKELYLQSKQQIALLQKQKQFYRNQAEQLKQISENQLKKFQRKLNNASIEDENCYSPVEGLQYQFQVRNRSLAKGNYPQQHTDYTNTDNYD